jgi:pimeloyl-ACP methyl ester carboxylesterase
MIRRLFIDCDSVQIHGRASGKGVPLVLLHAVPVASMSVLPQLNMLQKNHDVLALDLPGFGDSDPMAVEPNSLEQVAALMLQAVRQHGFAQFKLYGTATGGQVALRMAKQAPERILKLVVENVAHFSAAEINSWGAGYFPDLTAQADGSHLKTAWHFAENIFRYFPWHLQDEAHSLNRPAPPPQVVQDMMLAYLAARPRYDLIYRLAFAAERIESFSGLSVPTCLSHWRGSILYRQVQALIDQGLPPCVAVVDAGPTLEDRLKTLDLAFSD